MVKIPKYEDGKYIDFRDVFSLYLFSSHTEEGEETSVILIYTPH